MSLPLPPPGGEIDQACNFYSKLPREIQVMILELVLDLHRPIRLTADTNTKAFSDVASHKKNCVLGTHSWLDLPMPSNGFHQRIQRVLHCTRPFGQLRTVRIRYAQSVLESLTLTCREMKQDAISVFFSKNTFEFANIREALAILRCLPQHRVEQIGALNMKFTNYKTQSTFKELAQMCKGLRTLRLAMDVTSRRSTKDRGYDHIAAFGVQRLASAFGDIPNELRTLTCLELSGTDTKLVEDKTGKLKLQTVCINHPQAVGSWLRKKMLMHDR